ncbi:hypothetical protein [Cellulomonas carbonis]|nr:hypothetical protein [Cellulomonas carbonis]GGC05927.1 hypothetical protein GCM10010972_18900 [Cellulomonas carbonis]
MSGAPGTSNGPTAPPPVPTPAPLATAGPAAEPPDPTPDGAPLRAEQRRVLDVLLHRFDDAYGWWQKAYSTAAETALSFVGLAIIVAVLAIEAVPGYDPFDTAELVALVVAATVITLAGVTGRAVTVTAATRAQRSGNEALLAAADMLKQTREPPGGDS